MRREDVLAQVEELERRELARNAALRRRVSELTRRPNTTPPPPPPPPPAPQLPPPPPPDTGGAVWEDGSAGALSEADAVTATHATNLRLMHEMFVQQQLLLQRLVDAAVGTPSAAPMTPPPAMPSPPPMFSPPPLPGALPPSLPGALPPSPLPAVATPPPVAATPPFTATPPPLPPHGDPPATPPPLPPHAGAPAHRREDPDQAVVRLRSLLRRQAASLRSADRERKELRAAVMDRQPSAGSGAEREALCARIEVLSRKVQELEAGGDRDGFRHEVEHRIAELDSVVQRMRDALREKDMQADAQREERDALQRKVAALEAENVRLRSHRPQPRAVAPPAVAPPAAVAPVAPLSP
eukprot:TRINITY_DN2233_c1_g1_i1.p1 TRINITY_DN2233_c1_g1~~TRINITY_DN2233_c1_g1_i1.p1  ORF type:complete len:354 (+),score=172.76 TRINITY_DN2233_c1_g1_i1:63-1124(+)